MKKFESKTTIPRVSVVMPAYNSEKYIEDAVKCVQSQTFTDWELVIVNDCSTDATLDIALKLADNDTRIRVFSTPRQSGSVFTARKVAIDNSKADLIAPLDSDDLIPEDYLQRLLDHMSKTEADAVYPAMEQFSSQGEDIALRRLPSDEFFEYTDGGPLSGKEAMKYTLDGWKINCGGGLIEKSLYQKAFGLFPMNRAGEIFSDEFLTRIILYSAEFVAFSKVTYRYRMNDSSITHASSMIPFWLMRNNISIISFVTEHSGKNSEEYRLAQKQNFLGIFEAIEFLRRHAGKISDSDSIMAGKIMETAEKSIDWPVVKTMVSAPYYHSLRLSRGAAGLMLWIRDMLHGKKG